MRGDPCEGSDIFQRSVKIAGREVAVLLTKGIPSSVTHHTQEVRRVDAAQVLDDEENVAAMLLAAAAAAVLLFNTTRTLLAAACSTQRAICLLLFNSTQRASSPDPLLLLFNRGLLFNTTRVTLPNVIFHVL